MSFLSRNLLTQGKNSSSWRRSVSSESRIISYKRGTGGRSSFSGIVATVFGANGFIGKNIVSRLGAIGSQVIIPHRSDVYEVENMKVAADLGQLQFVPFHLNDEESIRRAMMYSNVVINCIGHTKNTRNFTLDDVHHKGAARIAIIAKELGIKKLIHFSHACATENPQPFYLNEGSEILRTKQIGENAVREYFPEAIIFRPSDIFSKNDKFLCYYAAKSRRYIPEIFVPRVDAERCCAMFLWKKGKETVKQPVYMADLLDGLMTTIQGNHSNMTIHAVGPYRYQMDDMMDFIFRNIWFARGCKLIDSSLPGIKQLLKFEQGYLKIPSNKKKFNLEVLEVEPHSDPDTVFLPNLYDLGAKKLVRLEDRAKFILKSHRHHNSYVAAPGEFDDLAYMKVNKGKTNLDIFK